MGGKKGKKFKSRSRSAQRQGSDASAAAQGGAPGAATAADEPASPVPEAAAAATSRESEAEAITEAQRDASPPADSLQDQEAPGPATSSNQASTAPPAQPAPAFKPVRNSSAMRSYRRSPASKLSPKPLGQAAGQTPSALPLEAPKRAGQLAPLNRNQPRSTAAPPLPPKAAAQADGGPESQLQEFGALLQDVAAHAETSESARLRQQIAQTSRLEANMNESLPADADKWKRSVSRTNQGAQNTTASSPGNTSARAGQGAVQPTRQQTCQPHCAQQESLGAITSAEETEEQAAQRTVQECYLRHVYGNVRTGESR